MQYKNLLKKILATPGRYISIVLIVFIGTLIYAGLYSTPIDLIKSADLYYKDTTMLDFRIVSTLGLTDEDVAVLKAQPGIATVSGTWSKDVFNQDGSVIRVHAIEDDINGYQIIKGRQPSAVDECVADAIFYSVGDKIEITSDTDDLIEKNYTVVGTIRSPLYISTISYGSTTIGDGKIYSFMYIPRANFDMEAYSEIGITATNLASEMAYSDSYERKANEINARLTALAPVREKARYDEVYNKAFKKLDKSQKKLDKAQAKGKKKLKSSKKKLDDGRREIAKGRRELARSERKLKQTMLSTEAKFAQGKKQIARGWKQIDKALKQAGLSRKNVGQTIKKLTTGIKEMKRQLTLIPKEAPQYAQLEAQIATFEANIAGLTKLQTSIKTLTKSEARLNAGIKTFKREIAKGKAQIANAKIKLSKASAKIDDGYVKYRKGVITFKKKIADGQKKLDKGWKKLDDIEMATWHILDRTDINQYEGYKNATEIITAITKVFPVFFVLIAILMVSNTMARMIAEERGELGTLTSLGYRNSSIVGTYLVYVLSASIFGALAGYYLGNILLPTVIGDAFDIFIQSDLVLYFDGYLLASILALVIGVMSIVTIISCWIELREKPAALMRPVPPKGGQKNIMLQRIPLLWNHMSFTWKVTMRNLFRSKQRALMILVGVFGCTALLITGFGLSDSISGVAEKQFKDIVQYDNMLVLEDDTHEFTPEIRALVDSQDLHDPLLARQESFTCVTDANSSTILVIVPQDNEAFKTQFNLYDPESKEIVELSQAGIVLADKFAELHGLEVGDKVTLTDGDNNSFEIPIAALVENYLGYFAYGDVTVYEKYFGKSATFNSIITKNGPNTPSLADMSGNLVDDDLVLTVANNQDALDSANNQFKSINVVVFVIVIVAALLAIVVLYNLTTINISERTREVATLKVLGFTNRETNSYIYRETILLTVMGIVIGYGFGIALHRLLVTVISNVGIGMFPRVHLSTFAYATVIVIVLAFLVQIVADGKLKRINMIDSLKSVE